MAVVVPIIVGRLPIAEQQGLTGRPVPLVFCNVVLCTGKDPAEPLKALGLEVPKFRIGLTKDNAPPFFSVSGPDKLSKVHEQSVSLAAAAVSLEKHLKERAGKKVRLGTRQGLPDDARFTAHSSLPWRPRPGPS